MKRLVHFVVILLLAGCADQTRTRTARTPAASPPSPPELEGPPLAKEWAAIVARSRIAPLPEKYGEVTGRARPEGHGALPMAEGASEVFEGSYRKAAKTSFLKGRAKTYPDLAVLLGPLPNDPEMQRDFPAVARKATKPRPNLEPRIALEQRNVKVQAWLYWMSPEDDADYHVVIGNTPRFTRSTIFMNCEVSGLPEGNPTDPNFLGPREQIRKLQRDEDDANGTFVAPVPVTVTGPLLWDGEHAAPRNVGPEKLRPKKAWEIHPLKAITRR